MLKATFLDNFTAIAYYHKPCAINALNTCNLMVVFDPNAIYLFEKEVKNKCIQCLIDFFHVKLHFHSTVHRG